MSTLQDSIEKDLRQVFSPLFFKIRDDSHKHQGHNHGGGKHFHLVLVSKAFENMSRMERHKKIYAVVGHLMPDVIHALSMQLYDTQEWENV